MRPWASGGTLARKHVSSCYNCYSTRPWRAESHVYATPPRTTRKAGLSSKSDGSNTTTATCWHRLTAADEEAAPRAPPPAKPTARVTTQPREQQSLPSPGEPQPPPRPEAGGPQRVQWWGGVAVTPSAGACEAGRGPLFVGPEYKHINAYT
jgi:hypothetical protein